MSDLRPFVDLDNRKLATETGGAFTAPPLVMDDVLSVGLRFLRRIGASAVRETGLNLRHVRASVGPKFAPPAAGGASLRFGPLAGDPSTADPVAFNSTAAAVLDALTGVSGGWTPAEVTLADTACWLIRFEQPGASPLQVGAVNTLAPRSFARVRAFLLNGVWWHELRFVQSPLAFTGLYDRVLPPAPSVRRIRLGRAGTDTEPPLNEIQALTIPPDFRGTYFLVWNFRQSSLLGIEDGPDEIAAAANAMFTDNGVRFLGSNPEPQEVYLEFTGALGEAPQALITVTVNTFEPGVPTFALNLKTAEIGAALRVLAQLDKSALLATELEIELEYVEDGEDASDPDVPSRFLTAQLPVKIGREQIYDELETVAALDWLRPNARDYVPFTPDQVIIGQRSYVAVFGNGAATHFSFAHDLGTDSISGLIVRENESGGRVLTVNAEYQATIPSGNELVLDFALAPAANSLVVILTTAGPASAFQAHTHTMAQIVGLLDALSALTARVAAIEDLLPTLTFSTPADSAEPLAIVIPDIEELFPNARLPAGADAGKPEALPRPPGLLPAIHDAAVAALALPLVDPAGTAGNAFENTSGSVVLIPGALGRRSVSLAEGGFAGSDGRCWFALARSGATNSYYPRDFERELFILDLAADMWKPGQRFSVEFDLELQLIRATTAAQYVLVVEFGTLLAQATPSPVDPDNLETISWHATPLLKEQIAITSLRRKYHFGARIRRALTDEMSADKLLYSAWSAADAVPAAPAFVLRARLIEFDTENNVSDARGYVFRALSKAAAEIA